jgi:hypothetical protein
MRRTAVRIVTAVALAVLSLPAAASAAWPGRNGRIFFSTPSGCGIASIRPDGSAYNCVDYFRYDPAVSPDDRHIVAVEGDVSVDVFGLNIDGSGARRFTRTTDMTQNITPGFSPDGRHIVFTKFMSSADGVYEMNSDGSGQHLLLTPGQDAVLSPSGTELAYDTDGIRVADASGGGSRLLVPNHNDSSHNGLTFTRYVEFDQQPDWSPDGRRIVFSRESHSNVMTCTVSPPACSHPQRVDATDVYVMNADGTGLRRLTSTPGFDEEDPHFSPDGTLIAYYKQDTRLDVAHGQIWVMRADGSDQHQVANGANPEWTSIQVGPGRPRIQFKLRQRNRRSKCLGSLDLYGVNVLTNASRKTLFDVSMFADGRLLDAVSNTRSVFEDAHGLFRRGRHRIQVTVDDAAVHDHISRTFTVRRC